MTTKVILANEIGNRIHDVFAGEYFLLGREPCLHVLSPWISNVEIKGKIPKMGPMSPQICYTFESIDLAHAILLARLLFDIEVNLVTKTPNQQTYSNPVYVKSLLDFLDEIGCKVFLNDNLHSKLLYTGNMAIVGSLNLTKSALYEREEIAVSIDDLENLSILADYAKDVMEESEAYGYTAYDGKIKKVTRGWLYHELGGRSFTEFQKYDLSIEDTLLNVETFYLESISKLCMQKSLPPLYLRRQALQAYKGPYTSEDTVITFLKGVLGRKEFPKVDFRYKNINFDSEEFLKQWQSVHGGKKTRQR